MAKPPRYRPKSCRGCGQTAAAARQIGYKGWCRECGVARMTQSVEEMRARKGPIYDRWRERMRANARAGRLRGVPRDIREEVARDSA